MRRILFSIAAIVCFCTSAYSAAGPVERGMDLYKKHHYEEAGKVLRKGLSSVRAEMKMKASLTLGMVYLKKAVLYRELYNTSLSVHLDYLERLSSVRGKARSRFAGLYMGEALLEAGKPKKAASSFRKFLKEKRVSKKYKDLARIGLGLTYYKRGNKEKAKNLWTSLKTKDPEVITERAAAYSEAGLTDKNPSRICEKAIAMLKKSNKKLPIRVVVNTVAVYAGAGDIEKGLDLIEREDLKQSSYEEAFGKNKVIQFYTISLLDNLSRLYAKASIFYIKKAADEEKIRDMAHFYLGEAYDLQKSVDESARISTALMSSPRIPKQYRENLKVRQAVHHYMQGKKKRAAALLNELAKRNPENPHLLAEILLTCGDLNLQCSDIVLKASTMVESARGKRFSRINYALGRYYLRKKDFRKSIHFMEAGRDKSNKNRIAYNDPMMLIHLAGVYYRTKKFSEALEIYFEMSKHFPAVRQIQVPMQGVYLMEQKSAGDVKIF